MMDEVQQQRERKGSIAVNLGLAANILLAIVKTSVGILGQSSALLADGVNSTSDVAYYLVVAVFMRQARKPADVEHPFGHSQLESIASLTVGSFVITTAITIFWDSINRVYSLLSGGESGVETMLIALWVALITVVAKIGLTVYTLRLGRQTASPAVTALAYDHRNDIFSALAAAIGITLARLGFGWVDPLAGSLVALVILRTGIEILRDSVSELMDTVPSEELENQVRGILCSIKGIEEIESVRSHRFGPYLVMNLTIGIDGSLSVAQGDQIATIAERRLYDEIDYLRNVHIHFHPARKLATT